MGSDAREKKRKRELRACFFAMGFLLCVLIPLLLLKRQMEARREKALQSLRKAATEIDSHMTISPKKTKCEASALRLKLIEIAMMSPEDALKEIDNDPLGVHNIKNASDWKCPRSERLLQPVACGSGPSPRAEAALNKKQKGAVLWFEHLSKAGGTSFCKFARQNVGFHRTPKYYCMPSDGAKIQGTDGRVGRWQEEKIAEYLRRTGHLVLANEWDAFPADALIHKLPNLPTPPDNSPPIEPVLATVVRDPLDRLVSAYKFWGITHGGPKAKDNPPDIVNWLDNRDRIARQRPHHLFPDDFLSQVARNNFASWKFAAKSGGSVPHNCLLEANPNECEARVLDRALDVLERFHILVPMTWQSTAAPLYRRLGWSKLDEIHVVPSGAKQNSAAQSDLQPTHYHSLRLRNIPDLLLFDFVQRAFLERLHCPRLEPSFSSSWSSTSVRNNVEEDTDHITEEERKKKSR
uniref:Sulfotransferase domain-containing protein n=1 Tax=Aureoumbra lagunensis TaxID=44058 RepID=A0A7S3NPL5_9STRA|mmetsp:Transcript_17882/g.26847  ORF Transcript_17882/g.26847 Transcript_17882/m.26847 type:complete len:464 (+) Transcript_17882:71-1462(+)